MPGIKLDVNLDDILKSVNTQAAGQPQSMGLTATDASFQDSFSHDIQYSIDNPGHTYAADNYDPAASQPIDTYQPLNPGASDPIGSIAAGIDSFRIACEEQHCF